MLSVMEMLQNLNEYQRATVLDDSPAMLVNANVGSGKTTVLIAKIFDLHINRGVKLDEMVVLTFTNKAANEIKERIKAVGAGISEEDMRYFGTFHSVALKLLSTLLPIEELGYANNFTVIDTDEMLEMALQLVDEYGLKIKYINKLLQRLEAIKSGKYIYANMKHVDDIDQLVEYMHTEKIKQNKMDFDDLIYNAITLLSRNCFNPKWIIIDEFQDCDNKQLQFINTIISPVIKIFAVGDPNQIIYSWRGSRKNLFSEFKQLYHAKELSLPINYRSSSTILEAAKCFISNPAVLEGIKEHGSRIVLKNHYNPFNEAQYLCNRISELSTSGIAYKNIAILYRLQKQSKTIEDAFVKAGIPFEVSIRKTLKDIPVLQWFVRLLKASICPSDKNVVISVLSNKHFGEGLSPKQAKKIIDSGDFASSALCQKIVGMSDWCVENYHVENILEMSNYFQLDTYLSPTSAMFAQNKAYIDSFLLKISDYISYKRLDLYQGLIEFLNSSTLYGIDILSEDIHENNNTVKLMTLHACKGLEFKYVFIIGVNFGLIPLHKKTLDEQEEEKRLFFVGITRAKDNLELSYYTSPDDMRVVPGASEYISMIPHNLVEGDANNENEISLQSFRREIKNNMEKQIGTEMVRSEQVDEVASDKFTRDGSRSVQHDKYGVGVVISEDGDTITVQFDEYGQKSFSKMFCPLKDV